MRTPPGERRRPEERHSPSVHLMGTRLVAMCRCGAILGGHRQADAQVFSLLDLLALSRDHNSAINNRR